ncbi:MAG: NFACT family protein [Planctomycetes bacterium]|nr:NFACT family protein [Planctomycetota bacterium]
MNLTADEIEDVLAELRPVLEGARVETIFQLPASTLLLRLRAPGATHHLLLCALPGAARIHAVECPPAAPPQPPPFCRLIREHLRGSRLVEIRQVPGDRIVELCFARTRPPPSGASVPTAAVRRSILLELFGLRPRIGLLDGERRILAALDDDVRGGGRRWKRGAVYERPQAPVESTGTESALARGSLRGAESARAPEPPAGAVTPFPFSRALCARYEEWMETEFLERRRAELIEALDRAIRKKTAALERVEEDLEAASKGDRYREIGDLLKGAYDQLRRGMESIEVVDYFSPGQERIRIPLDPKLSPRDNVERCFKRYRKARRALDVLSRRAHALQEEAQALRSLGAELRGAADLAALSALEVRIPRARAGGCAGRSDRRGPPDRAIARRFLSADGHEILVGRSAADNDSLTFRRARGNDLFLHAAGRGGPHVIIRRQPSRDPSQEALLDAAQLALYYSLPVRSGGVFIEGAQGDVDYTAVKHVRKPKGAGAGRVLLATHKTVRVRLDPERLNRLRQSSEIDQGGTA